MMKFTRRDCLRYGLGASAAISCDHLIPGFLLRTATALQSEKTGSNDRILVVVELDGGNDGLNTIVPYTDDVYQRNRPQLKIASTDVLKIDDRIGFAPGLKPFAELFEQQQLAVIQSVGYPNPSRSHFESMAIWQAARLDAISSSDGWLSRYLDYRVPTGTVDAPAIQVDQGKLALAFSGNESRCPSIHQLEHLQRYLGVPEVSDPASQREKLDFVLGQQRGESDSLLRFVQSTSAVSFASSERLFQLIQDAKSTPVKYPNEGLADRLKVIAQLIKARLNTGIYYTRLGGFDTHANQEFAHAAHLSELSRSVRAFFKDLTEAREADRVLMLVFSEFGRRLEQNASSGTDHGTAGPMFLIGPAVRKGVHGPYPDLVNLDDTGDPRFAIDFRQVYTTILERWLDCPPSNVISQAFDPLPVL